jgi:phage shock protein PspC (stress-responsive transcriptional regulator)
MSEHKRCPWCAEQIRAAAVKCRYCGSVVEPARVRDLTAPWTRRRSDRMIAGVCGGLADRLGVSVTAVRLAFLLALLFSGGIVFVVYVALWIAMPVEHDVDGYWKHGSHWPGEG